MTTPALNARAAVALSILCAPVADAVLRAADGHSIWPTVAALVAGLAARAVLPGSNAPLIAMLAVSPVWQVATGAIAGSTDPSLWMPWLAVLAGWLAWPRDEPWPSRGLWRAGVIWWAVVVALTWPVVVWRELDFTWLTVGASTANGSFAPPPHVAAAFVTLTVEAQLVALLLFEWAWSASVEARRRAWLALAPGLAAACALAVWQQSVDPALLSQEPWTHLNRAAGPFFDANATGALAVLAGMVVAGPALAPVVVPPVLWSGAWAVLVVAGVVASGSRTALAALVVSAALTGLVAMPRRRRMATVVAVAMLAALAARSDGPPSETPLGNAVGRLAGTMQRLVNGGAAGAMEVAWRRDGYGPTSMAVIADHPWVGVGPGVFATVVADYGRATVGTRLPPDNAQNWWRQQIAELGVLGGLGSLLCSALAALGVARAWRRSPAAALRAAPLVALGLMAFVSPPTQHPLLQVLAGLIVAHTVAPRDDFPLAATATAPPRAIQALAWAAAIVCAIGIAVEGRATFRPPDRAARFHFRYLYGVSDLQQTPFGEGRWSARRSVAVIPPEGAALVTRVVVPHDDLAQSPVTVTISDGHRTLCRHDAHDHRAFECRVPMPEGRWPLVQVDVSRVWRTVDGQEQAALVAARFEP